MEERTDAELVAEALAGHREAFACLVRRYQDYAYGTAIGMLPDFDLARDVVQEAFLAAYRNLRKLREPARFPGWLRGIVRHMAHRALREMERVRMLANELGRVAEPFATAPWPDRSAEDREQREIVRGALARLSAKNREAVSLYYVDGLSYTDIASFLRVTETTVRGRLQRGRAELRKELTMVARAFKEEQLPDDFSAEVKRLLDAAAELGEEHTKALRRLAEIGGPAVDPLCEALGDPRVRVRMAAARALCTIGDARALRPLLRILYAYAEDMRTGDAILRSGKALAIPGLREELLRIVRQGSEGEKDWAVQALAHVTGDDEVFDCLCRVFRDPGTKLRNQALWAL